MGHHCHGRSSFRWWWSVMALARRAVGLLSSVILTCAPWAGWYVRWFPSDLGPPNAQCLTTPTREVRGPARRRARESRGQTSCLIRSGRPAGCLVVADEHSRLWVVDHPHQVRVEYCCLVLPSPNSSVGSFHSGTRCSMPKQHWSSRNLMLGCPSLASHHG